MTDKLSDHPLIVYLTFILPVVLLALGIAFDVNVFLLIVVAAWLGVALMVLFLPIATDDGSSA